MKILVIGFGSIGKRHIGNIRKIDPEAQIAVLRSQSREKALGEYAQWVSHVFVDEKSSLDWKPEAVFVCNPAPFHLISSEPFVRIGCHVFMEKPFSHESGGIETYLKKCEQNRVVLQVGYVLRFLESLQVMKQAIEEGRAGKILSIQASVGRYLPAWRPQTDYRQNVSARSLLGGGVIAELSHELDYVRWLAGEVREVFAIAGKTSDLKIDVEDVAEISVTFDSGAIGHVHLDMLDFQSHRYCRVIGSEGSLVWNMREGHSVRIFNCKCTEGETLWNKEDYDYNEMFVREVENFFECIRNKREPLVTGHDGQRVVELIQAAKKSAQSGKKVPL